MTDRLTDQQLDEIEARAAHLWEYVQQPDEADVLAGTDVPALLDEVRRLQTALAREERLHGETIDDRDQAQEIADKLAYAVAPVEVIGEHSSMNCPWTNAFELITSAAEVEKLRATPPMVCINCETPVGWVDCPTGGWWAHETHPEDGHDADPRPARAGDAATPTP